MTHRPLANLSIADSTFHCFVSTSRSISSISQFHSDLRSQHPRAAHIPYAASLEAYHDRGSSSSAAERSDGMWDDGEPEAAAVGKELLRVLNLYQRGLRRELTIKVGSYCKRDQHRSSGDKRGNEDENGPPVATAVFVVRYFRRRLLGVTCGRLTGLYGRVARLALHRHLQGRDVPYIEKYSFGANHYRNVFGLGAGDTELILDVVPLLEYEDGEKCTDSNTSFVNRLLSELLFEKMMGPNGEVLPRLQNLQADLPVVDGSTVIPVYRYPGNYSGTEWRTHPWSPTTLYIKRCVEMALRPLYHQHMNHAVSNYYRDGDDRIDHHSDKDLDLNREGVIVSVSLGCMRVMELRDRTFPHDVSRVELPPGSMFVLGPFTNSNFTHSILPVGDVNGENNERKIVDYHAGIRSDDELIQSIIKGGGRISVTFRDARSFLDVKSNRLFGQGLVSSFETPILVEDGMITNDSLSEAVKRVRDEDAKEQKCSMFVAAAIGFLVCCAKSSNRGKMNSPIRTTVFDGAATMAISVAASYWYLRFLKSEIRRRREESDARQFFSTKSASGNKY